MVKISKNIITPSEFDNIIQIHQNVFRNEITTNLGPRFLKKLYEYLINKHDSIIIYEKINQEVIGFILFTISPLSIYKHITFRDLTILSLNILFSPILFIKIISQTFIKKRLDGTNEIFFFVVKESHQSKGIGSNLIEELIKKCLKNEIRYIYTKTNNNDLKNYYLKKYRAKIISKSSFWNMKYFVIEIPIERII